MPVTFFVPLPTRRDPRPVAVALLLLASVLAAPTAVDADEGERHTVARLTATFCDIGQNDASIVRAGEATVMVDTGHWRHDNALECLDELGVERLDLLVVTHAHSDHVGQARQVLDHVPVDEVWRVDFDPIEDDESGEPLGDLVDPRQRHAERDAAAYRQFDAEARRRAEEGGLRLLDPQAGHRVTIGALDVHVLHPDEIGPEDAGYDDIHDRGSIAVRIEASVAGHGDASLLFTGDAEAPVERRMVATHGDDLASDVYHMGHHGSATSTTQELVDAGGFEIAVWSAASPSPYGHPHVAPVRRLIDAGVSVYGTGDHGTVTTTADADGWSVTTEVDAPPTRPSLSRALEQLGDDLAHLVSPGW